MRKFYSYDYQESYKNMILANKTYIADLDQGKTLTASASTEGETRYWQARMYYRIDNGSWEEKMTGTYLVDGQGNNLNG